MFSKKSFLFLLLLPCSFGLTLNLDDHWTLFKTTFNKHYRSDEEEMQKQKIFGENIAFISMHNLQADMGKHTYKLGVNQLADMSQEEYKQINMELAMDNPSATLKKLGDGIQTPPSTPMNTPMDYRTQGMVGPVLNELSCNCSYAMAAVGVLEAELARAKDNFTALSVQNVIDCSSKEGNTGCKTGNVENAFKFIIDNQGINTAAKYPFGAVAGYCKFDSGDIAATVSYQTRAKNDEESFYEAINTVGPVTVSINAIPSTFQFYKSGIYDDAKCDNSKLTRALLAIGYGAENEVSYWLLKNSLGTSWGEAGYIRIARGKNRCGILDCIVYAQA